MRGFHRWLAYLIALPFLVVGVTGCLLVVRGPLDELLAPGLYATTPGTPTANAIRDALAAHAPDRTAQLVRLPHDGQPASVRLAGEPRNEVFFDPGTLNVLGERDPQSAPVAVLLDLHRRLALGKPGDWAIGIVGILLFIALLTGAWLWWVAPRRWSLGIRRTAILYDGHRMLGVVFLPLMLLVAITGIAMEFPDATRKVLGQPPRQQQPAMGEKKAQGDQGDKAEKRPAATADWDAILRAADLPHPTVLIFPRKPGDPITVRDAGGGSARIDAQTLAVASRTTGRDIQGWIFALHTGEAVPFAGIPLWLATGISLVVLLATGLWLRIARARRRANAAAPLTTDLLSPV